MAANLISFFETSKTVRGGKSVWVKDGNGENRSNVLLGATIANPPKGFGRLYAAQLFQYTIGQTGYIFRSFAVNDATSTAADTDIYLKADGYGDIPEVGHILMKAPASLTVDSYASVVTDSAKQVVTFTATAGYTSNEGNIILGLDGTEYSVAITSSETTAALVAAKVNAAAAQFTAYDVTYVPDGSVVVFTAKESGYKAAPSIDASDTDATATFVETTAGGISVATTKSTADYTGQSGKVTAVEYDSTHAKFKVTLDTAIGALTIDDIIVEATGTAASASAKPLVTNPNTFIEADMDLLPSTDMYGFTNVREAISTIYDKKAFTAKMQPLPAYVLAKNRSYIDGIFWI